LDDLWPLLDQSGGTCLWDIRNAAVHGDVFTEAHAKALKFAVQNLEWILERILLTALGWDFEISAVSKQYLRLFDAYHWKTQQRSLKL
jgi:hypothetical protein